MKIIEEIRKTLHEYTFYECFIANKIDMGEPNFMYQSMVPWLHIDTFYIVVSMQISEDAS
jgi:hypothetical protein